MDEVYENGMRIQESEVVKHLLPDIKSQVVHVGIVQKQTDAGEMTRFNAIVAVGNEAGWFGIGKGKASQMRIAIDKARLWQLGMQVQSASLCTIQSKRKGRQRYYRGDPWSSWTWSSCWRKYQEST
jgi:ribosomal protein S5